MAGSVKLSVCKRGLHDLTVPGSRTPSSGGCAACKRALDKAYRTTTRAKALRARSIADWNAKALQGQRPLLTPEQVSTMRARLEAGEKISALIQANYQNIVVDSKKYYLWARVHPEVHAEFQRLTLRNIGRSWPCRPFKVQVVAARRSGSWLDREALPAVEQVLPWVPAFMRDEVRQQLLLELWEGSIAPAEIPARAKALYTNQFTAYDLASKYGHVALDGMAFDDSRESRIHSISEEQGLWR